MQTYAHQFFLSPISNVGQFPHIRHMSRSIGLTDQSVDFPYDCARSLPHAQHIFWVLLLANIKSGHGSSYSWQGSKRTPIEKFPQTMGPEWKISSTHIYIYWGTQRLGCLLLDLTDHGSRLSFHQPHLLHLSWDGCMSTCRHKPLFRSCRNRKHHRNNAYVDR